jgi:hypothetical protein
MPFAMPRICLLKLLLATLPLALLSCSARPGFKVSSQGLQVCRERQADAAPGITMDAKRQLYRDCLKTIEAELQTQAEQDQAARQAQQQEQQTQALAEQAARPSAQERYNHCQIVQQEVIDAERMRIRTLGPAMVAARNHGANSAEAEDANANYQVAIAQLERLIPETMRAGQSLIPDAVDRFRRCDPADFND